MPSQIPDEPLSDEEEAFVHAATAWRMLGSEQHAIASPWAFADDLICLGVVFVGGFFCLTGQWQIGPPLLGAYLAARVCVGVLRGSRVGWSRARKDVSAPS